MDRNAILVLSGGQDSTTCLFWAKQIKKYRINAITFDYGQRHQREIDAAQMIAKIGEVDSHEIIYLGNTVLRGTSPLVNNAAELEQYKDHHSLPGGLEKTFVPMRNQLFLTIAYNRAAVHNAEAIITGVCEEDYGGYPDCRNVFIDSMEETSNLGLYGEKEVDDGTAIRIDTPLMHLTKAESIEAALTLNGCYEALAYTHTAYDGAFPPIGHDHATLLRAKGFEEANVPDPLVLRCFLKELMPLPTTPNYQPVIVDKYIGRIAKILNLMSGA